jgi:NarL family two-component system response regulator LiaR
MSFPIRLLIADDSATVRFGLETATGIFDDITLVGEATNGVELVRMCQTLFPDVALVDIFMPGSGIETIKGLRQKCPGVGVIVLTAYNHAIDTLKEAGLLVLMKETTSIDELATAIRSAAQREDKFV